MSAAAADVLKEKVYPFNYPADVLAVVDALAFEPKNVKVAGSMALRSQQYAADYDLFEIVESDVASRTKAVSQFARGFQENVKALLKLPDCYVGDIKCGEVSEWRVVTGDVRRGHVIGYDSAESRRKIDELVEIGVLTEDEGAEARRLVESSPSVEEFLLLEKEVRPHIIRWSVRDVLRGFLYLRDGRRFTLEDGIQTPALAKIDAVALVERSRFTDFSCIYSFRWKRTVLNKVQMEPEHELKKNIVALEAAGNYYKMAKRIFSLLKGERRSAALVAALSVMFNGDLGRLYSIISDMGTLLFLLENESVLPLKKVQYEVGQFRARMGNIFHTDRVNTERTLEDLLGLETATRAGLQRGLRDIEERLSGVLNAESAKMLRQLKVLPVPSSLRP
jgi:hypothetical protein